jgi:CBS domain containing-hemolysin-like protein
MESPVLGLSLLGLVAVAALILANGYFVATEFALVAVRRSQLKLWAAEGRRGAGAATMAVSRLDDAIAATQLGITLASLGLGWIGEPALAHLIEPLLGAVGITSKLWVHGIAITFAFAVITFLHVVIGELVPKAIALDHPGPVALACARPLLLFGRTFRWAIWFMNGTGNALVGLFGVRPTEKHRMVHSPEELSLLVSEAREAGEIRPYAGRILGNVFRISRIRVRDVMIPRERVFAIERRTAPDPLLDLLRESGYTRIPVYDGVLDNIVGVLHTKDLFHVYAQKSAVILADAIRPTIDIRPDLTLTDALREFRRGRKHLAVVREPGGPVLGVCTLEDILEEIVGEIEDEHDEPTAAGVE